ncbi:hypothetical protein BABINDRAFT_161566 [Babjeviella inositovora NRRL Y-12698]|uniref:DUF1774-domain-containing protein n=1 Tax=Babjeviella inositovora NRRL Y-12698 TaxID=984486 RepID=A0A1E3QQB1_9ASCO|nr:uncharacterized protein BABINDRAFT_161566 [Babjeviella inositovora NRRL Y-12698]ODQ79896.1 hypothetical protein BABINDRAFT_161566 [Babjeviella inositovora NRRL Y-12698]
MTDDSLVTHRVTTTVSLALSIWGTFKHLIFSGHVLKHVNEPFRVSLTPFTGNIIVLFVYWSLLYLLQIVFVAQIYFPGSHTNSTGVSGVISTTTRASLTSVVGWHFTIFNFLTYLWTLTFHKEHYLTSEIILVLNLLNILALTINHKTSTIKPLSNWIFIHLSTAALPFSWLLYAVFWNGAVLFHAQTGLFARIVANVLIWDFLFIPLFFVLIWKDWGIGLSSSLLTFGLGWGQLFTKVIALQWIFAFIISGILFVVSVITAFSQENGNGLLIGNDSEQAPLLSN